MCGSTNHLIFWVIFAIFILGIIIGGIFRAHRLEIQKFWIKYVRVLVCLFLHVAGIPLVALIFDWPISKSVLNLHSDKGQRRGHLYQSRTHSLYTGTLSFGALYLHVVHHNQVWNCCWKNCVYAFCKFR